MSFTEALRLAAYVALGCGGLIGLGFLVGYYFFRRFER